MSITSKLLTTVATISLASGAAFAQSASVSGSADTGTQIEVENGIEIAQSPKGGTYAPGWSGDLDTRYNEIADTQIAELIGMNVLTEAGDDVGEVDNFVLIDNQLKAVIGVGGFLGMGEHEVALPLSELTYDGTALIVAYTDAELREMPQYTEELEQIALNDVDTFRTRNETMLAPSAEMAELEQEAEAAAAEGEEQLAEAADATEDAMENAASETEQMAENVATDVEDATANAAASTAAWIEKMDAEFAEIADREIAELEGRNVATANGEVIGEIEDFGIRNGEVVAIVGIGGFLGLGEHDVALTMTNLTFNGENFVVEGYSEEELKEMPEYDADTVEILDDAVTLRASAS